MMTVLHIIIFITHKYAISSCCQLCAQHFLSAMASPPSCCGCGILELKSRERRSINNSEVVLHTWRSCLEEIGKEFDDFCEKNLMMCRKCFSAYERLYSLKKSVAENLVHAMSVLAPEDIASGSKRPRIDVPVLTANPVSTTTDPPDVAVNFLLLQKKVYTIISNCSNRSMYITTIPKLTC